ncbi:MAG: MarR family transcriptional regulator [Chloroflexi bacterium]|nr:MAG: hypothetical protein CUN54_04755 [Phototrophicales bacterium]RMF78906.1 MAG: MarR family transcriptional regulator [Chloroflexota bacterium]
MMPDTHDETAELAGRLLAVMDAIHKMAEHRPPGEVVGQLNINQMVALHLIRTTPGISQKQIAEQLNITAAAVSTAMRDLEAMEIIERRPDPNDARGVQLHLTRRGRALTKQMADNRRQAMMNLLAILPLEEQRFIVEALERALAAKQDLNTNDG